MKNLTRVILVVFTAIMSFVVCGQAYSSYCRATSTSITKTYFVNGVWNTEKEARSSMELVKSAYKRQFETRYPGQTFEFRLAYNYHTGKVRDVIEIIGQKMNELNDPEVSKLTADQYLYLYLTARSFDAVVPLGARPITTTIEEYLAGRLTDAVNADEIIRMLRNDLLEGTRLLLIAHSQGNMFANAAMFALMNEYAASIGMVGVASPAAVTYNNSPYFTAHDDRVIDALRVISNVLPSNVDNDPGLFNDPRDFSNHKFDPSYFAEGLVSRPLIDNAVYGYIATLQFPAAIASPGIITATLAWGAQPDVDLHAFEPNGIHVYYGRLRGVSGYLDLDDVTSYGPEHYFVSCALLETGTYRIGVNYYYGTSPETARIQIAAGTSVRSFTRVLPTALGSSGNNTPVPVADIVVMGDQQNGFTFDIREVVPTP